MFRWTDRSVYQGFGTHRSSKLGPLLRERIRDRLRRERQSDLRSGPERANGGTDVPDDTSKTAVVAFRSFGATVGRAAPRLTSAQALGESFG